MPPQIIDAHKNRPFHASYISNKFNASMIWHMNVNIEHISKPRRYKCDTRYLLIEIYCEMEILPHLAARGRRCLFCPKYLFQNIRATLIKDDHGLKGA